MILLFFAGLNFIVSLCVYSFQKKSYFALMSWYWIAVIINFILQAIAPQDQFSIILLFSFTLVTAQLLGLVLSQLMNVHYPVKAFSGIGVIGVFVTAVLNYSGASFMVTAMPVCVAMMIPLLYLSYLILKVNWSQSTALTKLMGFILIPQAIHCLNFALFREEPSSQLWGWMVSYALYQILACLLPALAFEHYYLDEKSRLNGIIDEKTKALETTLDQKNIMVKVLTHDISSCLVPLDYYGDRLSKKHVSDLTQDEFDKAMQRINVSTSRISSMIVQVRNFEALSSKKDSPLSYWPLSKCVDDSVLQFQEQLKTKEINLSINLGNIAGARVLVDPNSFINSVLSNLISNSIKFTHPGGSISVDAQKLDENKLELLFTDNGLGMSPEMIESIFSFHHNVSRDGTKGEKGTGFGLPILKKYVELYGGEVSVTSQAQTVSRPGQTCFRIVLKAQF